MKSDRSYAEILSDLIGFRSVSGNSNLDIAEYIEDSLVRLGYRIRRVVSQTGEKTSLLATVGKVINPGVVLSAHTDVVSAEGQSWSVPPFAATSSGNRIYGRGASDMKGFIAAVLAHAGDLAQAASVTPIHLAFSYDEEIGCQGAPDLVAATLDLPVRPALCIVGEPTGMRLVIAHKGKLAKRITFKGRTGHSAVPREGASALKYATRFAVELEALGERLAQQSVDGRFSPPHATLHVGSLHSGHALNVIPAEATVEFELRYLPDAGDHQIVREVEQVLERLEMSMKAEAAEGGIMSQILAAYPALKSPSDPRTIRLMRELAAYCGPLQGASFGTEAGLYAQAGIPTFVCGPGDMKRAHRPDEWIERSELEEAGAFLDRLASKLHRPLSEW